MNPEQGWIERLRRGDGSGLPPLMDRYGHEVYRTAALLIRDRHSAEDISQEVFLIVYQKIGQFQGEGSLRGWLLQITINLCRSRMRRASWRRLVFFGLEHPGLVSSDRGLERYAESDSLMGCIRQLPYKYREVIVLYYYRDMYIREMAELLGESEGTVKSKLSRAKRLLKKLLEAGGWKDESKAWE
ncbi:ECF RNA polymerase sigma factor SigW [Paenibacillus konkukensis]|uniref:ECF RNA polymerase sigma factor SigW n=1 Tax=Paenibacillus konkukensis TaxID=2020716 RepID=A0ABY4RQN8_9BACL|nr:sigma-70 family RNA polymerase sigma factor [Paenibacillus konkukensis]UQZ84280.1 ECF RNA polymerase sigma factor SigW [Paenibacillus konkukensis]